jgi:hypothetical protein
MISSKEQAVAELPNRSKLASVVNALQVNHGSSTTLETLPEDLLFAILLEAREDEGWSSAQIGKRDSLRIARAYA